MGKSKTTERKSGAAVRVQRIISPRLHELLATLKDHPWVRICEVCGKDCSREAITKLIYTHEACGCNAAPYRHLVDNIYHATCFVKRANDPRSRTARLNMPEKLKQRRKRQRRQPLLAARGYTSAKSKPDQADIKTKRYGCGGWTAWHPDYPNHWGAGASEVGAIADCVKTLADV